MENIEIKVNDKELSGVKKVAVSADGLMIITIEQGKKSIEKIAAMFTTNAKIVISRYGEVTDIYYNKAVNSAKLLIYSNMAEIALTTTSLEENAEGRLTERADISDEAIEELAGMVAAHEERLASMEEQIAALISASEIKVSESEKNNG